MCNGISCVMIVQNFTITRLLISHICIFMTAMNVQLIAYYQGAYFRVPTTLLGLWNSYSLHKGAEYFRNLYLFVPYVGPWSLLISHQNRQICLLFKIIWYEILSLWLTIDRILAKERYSFATLICPCLCHSSLSELVSAIEPVLCRLLSYCCTNQ